jgi:sec-independent protein translocase protein TatA
MLGLQPTHWLIIVVVAVLLFAPSRLPELMRSLGRTIREFRAGVKEAGSKEPPESGSAETPKGPSH